MNRLTVRGACGTAAGCRVRWPPFIVLLACGICSPVIAESAPEPQAANPPEPTADAAVLELVGDGFLQGKLAPSGPGEGRPRTTFHWKSPLFDQPIEFRVDAIRRIRLVKQPARPPADSWRADLQRGDVVVGELDTIDADHVVLRAAGVGVEPLRIRRDAVVRLARPTAAVRVILPGDTSGWGAPRGAVQGQAGRLVCEKSGSWVALDVSAPPRACFEIAVSWDQRPEFELHFAADPALGKSDAKPSGTESYRIEAVAGEALAIREGATAKFETIKSLPAAAGSLTLQVFVDQERGRLAVIAADDPAGRRTLFDETVAPRKPTSFGGIGLRLRKGGLRIDSLRVTAWKEEEPQFPKTADLGGPDAVVEAFDRAKGIFTVRKGDAVQEVPGAEVSAIEFPAQPPAALPPAESLLAVFHGGSRLSARLVEITASGVRLAPPSLADPLECGLAQVAVLEPAVVAPSAASGREGLLEAAGGRMLGSLSSPAGADVGIGWQPRGAVAPVTIGAKPAMKIGYLGRAGDGKKKEGDKPAVKPASGPATVYLKTGDSVQCAVLSAGPEGARIKTDLENDILVPSVAMRSMELLQSAAASIPKEKFARLLTLPRMQQADPPTHMLRLTSGDYLRGKLVSLDEKLVRFDVLGVVKEIPRSEAARLIWLSIVGDDSQERATAVIMGTGDQGGVPVRATMTDGRRLSFSATRVDGDKLVGRNGVFGTASVDLARCDQLDLGAAAAEATAETIPYSQWQLKPAALPKAMENR
jgi:hypothetical protein